MTIPTSPRLLVLIDWREIIKGWSPIIPGIGI